MRVAKQTDAPTAIGQRNVRGGLVLLAVGLALGLAMSLYAFTPMVRVPAPLDRYDDLPRRLIRLAHIAAIMLPVINVVVGSCLDRVALSATARRYASALMLAGAAGLPATLLVEAASPLARAVHLSAPPALGFCTGVFVVSVGALRRPLTHA